jgi:hypothetical protein
MQMVMGSVAGRRLGRGVSVGMAMRASAFGAARVELTTGERLARWWYRVVRVRWR